ncbi:hypothetical protein BDF20DRAFT_852936 [Mycotypha africana]|uniref:uncharacterized protein n=1 Tax=Mycotypha africana TaxID=64632 RepID=UPI002300465B|nr:uncharacterized protein BDF20DRAFT_852936 [Mycotypha africana]KAI8987936.1 hypothetical protein BDF20DRAFT_852936 [Mycotypha africana]
MTQQCQKQPDFTDISTAATEPPNPSSTFRSKNICFNCSANVPWSLEHATKCTRDKQQQHRMINKQVLSYQHSTRAIRSAKFINDSTQMQSKNASNKSPQSNIHNDQTEFNINENTYPPDYKRNQHTGTA